MEKQKRFWQKRDDKEISKSGGQSLLKHKGFVFGAIAAGIPAIAGLAYGTVVGIRELIKRRSQAGEEVNMFSLLQEAVEKEGITIQDVLSQTTEGRNNSAGIEFVNQIWEKFKEKKYDLRWLYTQVLGQIHKEHQDLIGSSDELSEVTARETGIDHAQVKRAIGTSEVGLVKTLMRLSHKARTELGRSGFEVVPSGRELNDRLLEKIYTQWQFPTLRDKLHGLDGGSSQRFLTVLREREVVGYTSFMVLDINPDDIKGRLDNFSFADGLINRQNQGNLSGKTIMVTSLPELKVDPKEKIVDPRETTAAIFGILDFAQAQGIKGIIIPIISKNAVDLQREQGGSFSENWFATDEKGIPVDPWHWLLAYFTSKEEQINERFMEFDVPAGEVLGMIAPDSPDSVEAVVDLLTKDRLFLAGSPVPIDRVGDSYKCTVPAALAFLDQNFIAPMDRGPKLLRERLYIIDD